MQSELPQNLKKLADVTEAGVYRAALNLSASTLAKYEAFLGELNMIIKEDDPESMAFELRENIEKFSNEMSERFVL